MLMYVPVSVEKLRFAKQEKSFFAVIISFGIIFLIFVGIETISFVVEANISISFTY